MKQGTAAPTAAIEPGEEQLGLFLHKMMLIRRFEEKAARCTRAARSDGFLHLYTGQEACAVGAISALRDDDYIVSHYREHGHALARGLDPKRVMAELFGQGRRGQRRPRRLDAPVRRQQVVPRRLCHRRRAHLPLAVRSRSRSNSTRARSASSVNFLGDGAVNEGEFHESLNLAAALEAARRCSSSRTTSTAWALPCSASQRSSRCTSAPRRTAFTPEQVDGMDVVAMH